jgi:N-acetylmuramoyl-L-alanine amidase
MVVRLRRLGLAAMVVAILVTSAAFPSPSRATGGRYFPETGFAIDSPDFLNLFDRRGGLRTFGYPISREFTLLGFPVQMFQRAIMQRHSDGRVALMNLLHGDLFPFTQVNGAVLPAVDNELIKTAPAVGSPGYDLEIAKWISRTAPDQWSEVSVLFGRTFLNTVTLADAYPAGDGSASLVRGLNLEIWGVPTSKPAYDPRNKQFVYQRFQRGIMHHDRELGRTQGILLADYFKSILMGERIPADLAAEAKSSPYFFQYNPLKANWTDRPNQLPNTNLTRAFEPEPSIIIDAGHGAREIGSSFVFPDGLILREKDLALEVANRTAAILRQGGFRVVQTRTTDAAVNVDLKDLNGDGRVSLTDELQSRLDMANNARGSLLLSVHFNGSVNVNHRGVTVYYNAARTFGRRNQYFSNLVSREVVAALRQAGYDTFDRGVQTDTQALGDGHFYLLGPDAVRPSQMPGALLEALFLTNPQDAQALRDPKIREALARGTAKAIRLYYGQSQ